MANHSRLGVSGLFALCAALFAGCGGGDNDSPEIPLPPPPAGPTASLIAGVTGGADACDSRDGSGVTTRLGNILDLRVGRDGSVYVLEGSCDDNKTPLAVRKIGPPGEVRTLARADLSEAVSLNSFRHARHIAVGDGGNVYVSEGYRGPILPPISPLMPPGAAAGIWKISGTTIQAFVGIENYSGAMVDGTGTQAEFKEMGSIIFGEGSLFSLDSGNAVRRISEAGVVTTVQVNYPWLADTAGSLYVKNNDTLQQINGPRTVPLPYPARWEAPINIALSDQGVLYGVRSEPGGVYSIYRRTPAGAVEPVMGTWQGQTSLRPLSSVEALALDRAGNLYVLEKHALWKITF